MFFGTASAVKRKAKADSLLEVLSSMAESDGFNDIEFSDEGQDLFDEMMEEAVLSAADSEEGGAMLANA